MPRGEGKKIAIAILEKMRPGEEPEDEEESSEEEEGIISAAEELLEAISDEDAEAVVKSIRYIHDHLHAEKHYNDGPYGEKGGDKPSDNPGKTKSGGNPRPKKRGNY